MLTEIPDNLTCDSLDLLHRELTGALAAKFEAVGIQLGMELPEIEALSYQKVDMNRNLHTMLSRWRDGGKWRDEAEPLRQIFEALESASVRRTALAKELRDKWKDCFCELMCLLYFSFSTCFLISVVD